MASEVSGVPRPAAGLAGAAEDQPAPERPARACLTLPARAEQVRHARAFIGELLGSWHPCTGTAVLLASELVTNSVRHSGSRQFGQTITITAILQDSEVRVEVTDSSGPTVPAMRAADEIAEGGRGLQLVQALAATWGYWRDDSRTTTWFVCMP
jgi:anti-sigma regulatory factor (Ser/Thr protein kinase)